VECSFLEKVLYCNGVLDLGQGRPTQVDFWAKDQLFLKFGPFSVKNEGKMVKISKVLSIFNPV
jgi:hypothetical protein